MGSGCRKGPSLFILHCFVLLQFLSVNMYYIYRINKRIHYFSLVGLCFKKLFFFKFNGFFKSFAIHRFWCLIYLMPWLMEIFPIHVGIQPAFPDFLTSRSQPQQPSQPNPFLWFPAQAAQWEGEGRGRRREAGGDGRGEDPRAGPHPGEARPGPP